MEPLLQNAPLLAIMLVLLVGSAFFSSSEAALFYLTRDDRERFVHGSRAQRRVVQLLERPETLLTSVLFWNLVINIGYFAIAASVGLSIERRGHTSLAAGLAAGSLLAIILLSEMVPKNLAVLWPRAISTWVSMPLTVAVWVLSPILPLLRSVNRISLRTLIPDFVPEPYLELRDIERAISLSTPDKTLARQEELVLHQIVSLSEMKAEELMRPRSSLYIYQAPITMADLRNKPPRGEHLLVAESDSGEIDRAIPLAQLATVSSKYLELECDRVPYLPWCASAAATLDVLKHSRGGLAVVVNEFGESIGIVTFDDVMHALFSNPTVQETSRVGSQMIEPLDENVFRLNGALTLRRLRKQLHRDLPEAKSVTVAGLLQESLQRLPQPNDEVLWGDCKFRVIESPRPGLLTATVEVLTPGSQSTADGGGGAT